MKSYKTRNPPWRKEELILAMDLYFRLKDGVDNKTTEMTILSGILRSMPRNFELLVIHPNLRNLNSIKMKIANFAACDSNAGKKGLESFSSLDREIWDKYESNRGALSNDARAILSVAGLMPVDEVQIFLDSDFDACTAEEGAILYAKHRKLERASSLSKKKKSKVLKDTGALKCEVCSFDFKDEYGTLGEGFAECHHRIPLASLAGPTTTRLDDLAIVCSNCHRMLHRRLNVMSLDILRATVEEAAARRKNDAR